VKLSKDLDEEATIDIPPADTGATAYPAGISTDGDGNVWVAAQDSGVVYEIDAGAEKISETYDNTGAAAPFGIARAGSNIWVVDRTGNQVIKYDIDKQEVVTSIPVGANPKGVAIAGNAIFVANTDDGTVSVIGLESNEAEKPIDVKGQPRAVDVLGSHVWVSNGDEVSAVDAQEENGWVTAINSATHEIDGTVKVGGSPEGVGVGDDRVWVATGTEQLARAIEP